MEIKLVTLDEASEVTGVSKRTLNKQVRDGTRDGVVGKGDKFKVAVDVRLLEEAQGVEPGAVKTEEEAKPVDPELLKLNQEKARLVVQKEVKALKAEIAGIASTDDRARMVEEREALEKGQKELADQVEANAEVEDRSEALKEIEGQMKEWEDGEQAREDERKALAAERVEVEGGKSFNAGYQSRCLDAEAAASKMQREKWDLARFLVGTRETLKRTLKGASAPLRVKDAQALIWQKVGTYDGIYGAWTTDKEGHVLVDGEPIKSWQQEKGIYDEKNTSTI